MTVQTSSSTTGVIPGNGVATEFPFSQFQLLSSNSELVVTHVAADGTETTLVEGVGSSNYSVQLLGPYPSTGQITYPASGGSPMPNTEALVIRHVIGLDQQTDLENQGGYYPDVVEQMVDKTTYQVQQLQEELDRCVKVSPGSGIDPDALITEIQNDVAAAAASASAASASAGDASSDAAAAAASAAAAAASAGSIALPIPVASGGTGATTAAQARTNLGIVTTESFIIALTPEAGAAVVATPAFTFRMPYAWTMTSIRASLNVAQESGSLLTLDIKKNGTSMLSTLLTFDNTEKTTVTAVTAYAISTSAIASDDEISIHVTQIGNGSAQGLKFEMIGHQ